MQMCFAPDICFFDVCIVVTGFAMSTQMLRLVLVLDCLMLGFGLGLARKALGLMLGLEGHAWSWSGTCDLGILVNNNASCSQSE